MGCVNKSNYNQGTNLNGFTGLVSFLPATDTNLFRVKGGFSELVQKLLEASKTKVDILK